MAGRTLLCIVLLAFLLVSMTLSAMCLAISLPAADLKDVQSSTLMDTLRSLDAESHYEHAESLLQDYRSELGEAA